MRNVQLESELNCFPFRCGASQGINKDRERLMMDCLPIWSFKQVTFFFFISRQHNFFASLSIMIRFDWLGNLIWFERSNDHKFHAAGEYSKWRLIGQNYGFAMNDRGELLFNWNFTSSTFICYVERHGDFHLLWNANDDAHLCLICNFAINPAHVAPQKSIRSYE